MKEKMYRNIRKKGALPCLVERRCSLTVCIILHRKQKIKIEKPRKARTYTTRFCAIS